MRFVFFRTPKPKSFSYHPRYFDAKKEEWKRKKAAHGLVTELSRSENLRLEISKRWKRGDDNGKHSGMSKIIVYTFYILFIGGSIYFILFTDIIEKLVALFGVTIK